VQRLGNCDPFVGWNRPFAVPRLWITWRHEMQASTILSWRSRNNHNEQTMWTPNKQSFFERHQVGQIVSGLVMSSVLWGLLAVGVYAVYALVLGS
jgi:hypothetical protein